MKPPLQKFQFNYGCSPGMSVTVRAKTQEEALDKARTTMDRRYEKAGREAPVAWTLRLVRFA